MKLHYKKHLKPYSQELRRSGNLAEVLLWNELKCDKLGHRFLRQKPIGDYIVDFYCHASKLVIEVDGAASHDTKIDYDKERQMALELLGVAVIRFRDADVRYNLAGVVQTIKSHINQIVKSPSPPFEKGE